MECQVCEGLQEVIDDLVDENNRLRNRNRVLMSVKNQLRRKVLDIMKESDEQFVALCAEPELPMEHCIMQDKRERVALTQADGFAEEV